MLRKPGSRAAIGVFIAFLAHAQALPPQPAPVPGQNRPAVPKAAPPQPESLDIGAQEAPLSDEERTELDRAVAKHNYAAEKAVIERAMTEHPESFELLVMAGRLSYLEKNPRDAADAFARADKIKPLGDTDRMTLALALGFSNRVPQARVELLKLIQLSPRNAEYSYLLGRLDANTNHFDDAATEFRKATELDPTLVRAYEDPGRAQEILGLADEARKTYELGVLKNRANKVHWEWSPLDLGVFLLKAGEFDEADKLLREALEYNPHAGTAHYYRGQLLQRKNLEAEAMAEYKQAVADQPRLRQAWLALGRQYTRQGNQAEAVKALQMFKKLESEDNARLGRKN